MKICYIADPIDPNTQRWINYFAKRGHEVHLIVTRRPKDELEGIVIHDSTPVIQIKKIGFLARLLKVKRILQEVKPDLLHVHYVAYKGWLGALSGFQPLVMTAWGSDIYLDAKKSKFNYLLTQYTLRRARLVTSESKDILRRVKNMIGNYKGRLAVIQWGVDLEKFHPRVNGDYLRERLNLGDSPVIFSPRKFEPNYNIDIIVRAIPLVLKQIPLAKFVLKNYLGSKREEIENLAQSMGVTENCRFVGGTTYSEMAAFYNIADVVVSVPSSDSVSIAMLEAMACGTTVVVSDLPATKEWVSDEVNGLIVPPRNVEALADAIIRILKDESLREKFRAYNLALVREKANHYKEMAKMDDLYRSLL